ncbi:MAG: hypothetical protein IKY82_05020 [Alistipes sp.]|nr:hypothetical protein [Alistipes sp.]
MARNVNIALWLVLVWFAVAGCTTSQGVSDSTGEELIADARFERGVALSPLWPHIVQKGGGFSRTCTDTLRFQPCDQSPIWQLCQWSSRYDLAGAEPTAEGDCIAFSNEGKRVALSRDGVLTLGLTTSREYDHPRRADEPWTHLLVQQDFPEPPRVGKLEGLQFQMELRIDHCLNRMGEEFDESLHTAQAPFYLMVRNINPQSEEHGLGLWVGIPTFDYRYERLAERETVHWDVGTSTFIYTIPPRTVWGDVRLGDGEWHRADYDILPLVRRAVEAMREKGSFTKSDLNDLAITGMNFGWEIPGTFDAALEMKRMSLKIQN